MTFQRKKLKKRWKPSSYLYSGTLSFNCWPGYSLTGINKQIPSMSKTKLPLAVRNEPIIFRSKHMSPATFKTTRFLLVFVSYSYYWFTVELERKASNHVWLYFLDLPKTWGSDVCARVVCMSVCIYVCVCMPSGMCVKEAGVWVGVEKGWKWILTSFPSIFAWSQIITFLPECDLKRYKAELHPVLWW